MVEHEYRATLEALTARLSQVLHPQLDSLAANIWRAMVALTHHVVDHLQPLLSQLRKVRTRVLSTPVAV